uniref:Uncharacterized protein n=1 Tax=Oryza barthii TaxID=65489 RepID=A0A0D3HP42_9ORYZ
MAAGRRGRGNRDGVAVGLSTATAARRWGSPRLRRRATASPDPVAPLPNLAGVTGDGLGRRRQVAGEGLLRRGLVGDDGIGSAAAHVQSTVAPVRLSVERAPAPAAAVLAGGTRPTAVLPVTGTAPPSPSLLFLQIRFSSSVVLLPVLIGGATPAPLFLGAPPFLG